MCGGRCTGERHPEGILDAGLNEVDLDTRDGYISAMADWHDPLYQQIIEHLSEGATPADYVTSLAVSARKPKR